MSIIEDALKRLQKQRAEGESAPPSQPFFDPGFVTAGRRRGRGRLAIYAAFAVASAALAGGAWLGLDLYQEVLRSKAHPAAMSGNYPPERALAPPAGENKIMPSPDVPAGQVEEKGAPAVTETEAVLAADAEPAPAPAPDDEDDTAIALAEDSKPEPARDAERLVEMIQSAPPAAAGVRKETASEGFAGGGAEPESEAWIAKGWAVMKSGGLGAALEAWEEGLKNLDPNRIVYIVKVYESRDSASAALDLAGEGSFAFLARGGYEGGEAYYLLAAPARPMMAGKKREIQKTLSLNGVVESQAGALIARMREEFYAPRPVMTAAEPAALVGAEKIESVHAAPAAVESAPAPSGASIETAAAPPAVMARKPKTAKPPFALADRYAQARRLIGEGAYAEAVEVLQSRFEEAPESWEPYFLIGTAYLGLGRLDLADKYLGQGIAVDAGRARLWLQKAVVAQQRGDNAGALRLLMEASRLDPAIPEVHLNIGYSSEAAGDRQSAVKAYRAFLSLSEDKARYRETRDMVIRRLVELGY